MVIIEALPATALGLCAVRVVEFVSRNEGAVMSGDEPSRSVSEAAYWNLPNCGRLNLGSVVVGDEVQFHETWCRATHVDADTVAVGMTEEGYLD
ncbi:hypothetical protein QGN31_06495 [Mycobacterium sp. 2-64]|uniref:hypothetical protein n=1 Tax=Mycobacterium sp. 2-64 TaxID=3042319 RepID=UPI002DD87F8A|nr:hypothetical protein [Mycobacterium sp. 2-64]WSE52712.1 hypothetical protein QGN31_06495 [Mycobacterium sp. 2-64]